MYQYKLRYRDWDIAADFSNALSEIYIEEFEHPILVYEGASKPNVIEFFEILDSAIDKYEAEREAERTVARSNTDSDRDDIPF